MTPFLTKNADASVSFIIFDFVGTFVISVLGKIVLDVSTFGEFDVRCTTLDASVQICDHRVRSISSCGLQNCAHGIVVASIGDI
jgi:hypothetical protein